MGMLGMEVAEKDGSLYLISPYFRVSVSGEIAAKLRESGLKEVIFGIRPEDVALSIGGETLLFRCSLSNHRGRSRSSRSSLAIL